MDDVEGISGAVDGVGGPGIESDSTSWLVTKNGEVDWRSTPNFGHTFSTHGEGSKNTKAFLVCFTRAMVK